MDYLYDTMVLQQHQQKQQNLSLQVFWEAIKIIVKRMIRTESFRDTISNRLQSCECMFYKHTWALTYNKCITLVINIALRSQIPRRGFTLEYYWV